MIDEELMEARIRASNEMLTARQRIAALEAENQRLLDVITRYEHLAAGYVAKTNEITAENARLREELAETQRIEKELEAVGTVLTVDKVYQNRDAWELDQNHIAELREDRERLDFISQGNINAEEATEIVNGHRYKGKYRGSIRAAIDAARKGEGR